MSSLSAVEKAAACECSRFIDLDGRFSLCSEALARICWFFCMKAEFPLVFWCTVKRRKRSQMRK